MNNLNNVVLQGFLARDPELKYTGTGAAICNFSIGVNRAYKQGAEWKEEVSFFDVTVWNKLAEKCATYKKGQGVVLDGQLRQERWEKDGQNRSRVTVTALHVFPTKKEERDGNE